MLRWPLAYLPYRDYNSRLVSFAQITKRHATVSAILLTKTTAAQNDVALSYHKVRALYFLAVVFVRSIEQHLTDARNIKKIKRNVKTSAGHGESTYPTTATKSDLKIRMMNITTDSRLKI